MGLCGAMLDFIRLTGTLETAPQLAETLAPDWLVRDLVLLSVSILLALAGALAWLVLTQWLTLVTGARRDVLDLDVVHPLNGDMKDA